MGSELLPFEEVAALIATASVVGVLLLTPLYISQRRDIERLRKWMLSNPSHAGEDLAASENRLDRTEVELERLYAERGEPVPGDEAEATEVKPGAAVPTGVTPAGSLPAATRVTHERPALERITMERAALQPHPRWRRFAAEAMRPRWLALVALVAMIAPAAGIIGVEGLLKDDSSPEGAPAGPSGIEVAVLNTTTADGLAGQVSKQVERAGFLPGSVESFMRDADQTVVMYEPGQKRAAKRVARELDIGVVQPIDRQVETAVPEANVVVVLGEDRVRR